MSIICTAIITIVILFHEGTISGLASLFRCSYRSIINLEAWLSAFLDTVQSLHLAEGGHSLLGSHLPPSTDTSTRVTYLLLSHCVTHFAIKAQSFMAHSYLSCALNVQPGDLGLTSDDDIIFIMYPTVFGIIAAPQLWASLYFLEIFLLTSFSSVLQVSFLF